MKIACVLGPKFEDSEFKDPYEAFRAAGHEVTVVGLEAGAQLPGEKGEGKGPGRKSFKGVKPDPLHPLLAPGGATPGKPPAPANAVAFVEAIERAGQPGFAT